MSEEDVSFFPLVVGVDQFVVLYLFKSLDLGLHQRIGPERGDTLRLHLGNLALRVYSQAGLALQDFPCQDVRNLLRQDV